MVVSATKWHDGIGTNMDEATKAALGGQAKILLGAAIAYASGKGWISSEVGTNLAGMLFILAPMAWSWWSHRQSEAKIQVRETAAVQAGVTLAQSKPVVEPIETKDAQAIIKNFGTPPDSTVNVAKDAGK